MSQPNEAAQEFQFIGADLKTAKPPKIMWPQELQAIVIRNKVINKMKTTLAYANGLAEYNALVESGEIEGKVIEKLPKSYTNHNSGAVYDGMSKRFLKRCNKKKHSAHEATKAAAVRFGIIQPTKKAKEVVSDESEVVTPVTEEERLESLTDVSENDEDIFDEGEGFDQDEGDFDQDED